MFHHFASALYSGQLILLVMPPEKLMISSDNFRSKIKRKCIGFDIGGFRPSNSPSENWFGKVQLGAVGEAWPFSNGLPMLPLAQVNLESLPYRPNGLEDIAFLTVFIDSEALPSSTPNGDGWLIRTYRSVYELVELTQPNLKSHIKAFPMRPRQNEIDYPCWEDVDGDVPAEIDDHYFDLFDNVSGFKLGGWPSLIQSEIYWAPWNKHPAKPEYVFQIDSNEKASWFWGDSGVGYFGRGTSPGMEDEWAMEWQCY